MFMNTANPDIRPFGVKPAPAKQRGDTMIEVLVTIIIIAVGVLGAAALQITTLKNLSSSRSASVAAILAEDLSERMRANPGANYLAPLNALRNGNPPAFVNCAQNTCTSAQLAAYDISIWWNSLNQLPSGTARLTRPAGSPNTFVITVRWDEDRSGSTGNRCPPRPNNLDLECFQLNVTIQ